MPRILSVALALAAGAVVVPLSGGLPGGAAYARADAQNTRSYAVDLAVRSDGRIDVTEKIVFDFGAQEHHGITREIPTQPAKEGGVFVESPSATSPDGAPAATSVQRDRSSTTLRVGDPDRTVSGVHTYVVRYTAGGGTEDAGADTSGAAKSKVAWNAIGTKWETPIAGASVRLHGPATAKHVRCYAGLEGTRDGCGKSRGHGHAIAFRPGALAAGEGVTVEAEYPGSAVTASALTSDRDRVAAEEGDLDANPDGRDQRSSRGFTWGLIIFLLPVIIIVGAVLRIALGGGRGGGGRGPRGGGGVFLGSSGNSFGGGFSGGGFGGFGGGGGGVGGGGGGGGGGSW